MNQRVICAAALLVVALGACKKSDPASSDKPSTATAATAGTAAAAAAIATQPAPKGWPADIPVCAGKIMGNTTVGDATQLDLQTPETPEKIFAFYKSSMPGYEPSMDRVVPGNAMLTMTGPAGKFTLAAVTTKGHNQATLSFTKKH